MTQEKKSPSQTKKYSTQLLTLKPFAMKNKIMMLVIVLGSFYSQVNSQSIDSPFMMTAQVKSNRKSVKHADVKVYDNNAIVEVLRTNEEGKFSVSLQENKQYTIEISKDEFYTKRISVSTKTNSQITDVEAFALKIEIKKQKENQQLENSALDFPFALINYNEKGYFQYHGGYSEDMKAEEDYVFNETSQR